MDPAAWLAPAATVLAALITAGAAVTTAVVQHRGDRGPARPGNTRPVPRSGLRWWLSAGLLAAAVSLAAGIAEPPWGWAYPAGSFLIVAAVATVRARVRSRRHPRVGAAARELLRRQAGRGGGFPYDRDTLPDLVVVYTDNDLTEPGSRGREQPEQSAGQQKETPQAQARVSFEEVLEDPAYLYLAITGEAGIGKTSLLQYWAHELARGSATPAKDGPRAGSPLRFMVPVLIAARELVGKEHVGAALGSTGEDLLAAPPGRGMTWLVMIDTFDEITDIDDRREVERIVFQAVDQAAGPGCAAKFVLTTRGLTEERWRSFDSRGITEFRLQPFTLEQLRTFLVKRETSVRDRGRGSAARTEAEAKADRFISRWERADNLLELLRLPLLARVAATIYFEDDRAAGIPARRVDIYHDAVEHWISQFNKRLEDKQGEKNAALELLGEWGDACGARGTENAVRALLELLATRHLEDSRSSLLDIACGLLGVPGRSREPRRWSGMKALLEATGLIYDVHTDQPRFLHKTFAEFLAAPAIAENCTRVGDWSEGFKNPERRIGTVFAFDGLPMERKRALIEAMTAEDEHAIACGWIAAEGLCVTEHGLVDRQSRATLIEVCMGRAPGRPTEEWWAVIRMLASIDDAQRHLHASIDAGEWPQWVGMQLAGELAEHCDQGVDLLRRYADQYFWGPFVGVDAAVALAKHDRAEALERLRHLATTETVTAFVRVKAADALADHEGETGLELLRAHAADETQEDEVRVSAAGDLASHDRAAGVALLRAFAGDTALAVNVRGSAARGLVKYDREAGVSVLREIAATPDCEDNTRVLSADELVAYERDTGIALLGELMNDRSNPHWVRVLAANHLASHDAAAGVERLRRFASDPALDDHARVIAVIDLLAHERETALARLREFTADETVDEHARVQAAYLLTVEDRRAGPDLLRELASSPELSDAARLSATSCLCEWDRLTGPELLRQFASEPSFQPRTRVASASNLLNSERGPALAHLQKFAEDRCFDGEARAEALTVLLQRAPSIGVGLARRFIAEAPDTASEVRVAGELARHDRESGLRALRRAAADPLAEGRARIEAAKSLMRHDRTGAVDLLAGFTEDRSLHHRDHIQAARALTACERRAGTDMLGRLAADESTPDDDRVTAAYWLSRYEEAAGVDLLRRYASSPAASDSARAEAAFRLAERDLPEGLELLRKCAADSSMSIEARRSSARRLAEFDFEASLSLLQGFTADETLTATARVEAADALAEIDRGAGLPLLREYATDPKFDIHVRVHAARRLSHHDRLAGAELLHGIAHDDKSSDSARVTAADGLVGLDRLDGLALLREFGASARLDGLARVNASRRLAHEDRQAGIALLRGHATDADASATTRCWAAIALAWFDHESGREHLMGLKGERSLDAEALDTAAAELIPLDSEQAFEARRWLADLQR